MIRNAFILAVLALSAALDPEVYMNAVSVCWRWPSLSARTRRPSSKLSQSCPLCTSKTYSVESPQSNLPLFCSCWWRPNALALLLLRISSCIYCFPRVIHEVNCLSFLLYVVYMRYYLTSPFSVVTPLYKYTLHTPEYTAISCVVQYEVHCGWLCGCKYSMSPSWEWRLGHYL